MALESIDKIFQRAADRKGGEAALNSLLGEGEHSALVAELSDDRILAAMTKKIFQSGFVWRVVEQKWPDFERIFFEFDIEKMLMMPDELWETKASDASIIRNFNKVKTIKANAQMIFNEQQNGHSFAQFIAQWPSNDIIGLCANTDIDATKDFCTKYSTQVLSTANSSAKEFFEFCKNFIPPIVTLVLGAHYVTRSSEQSS